MGFARVRAFTFCIGLLWLFDSGLFSSAADEETSPADSPIKADTANAVIDPYSGMKAGDERDDNGLKIKLCWCPAGTFRMGSTDLEPRENSDEGPVDVILTQGFWIGKFEVSQSQWKETVGTEPWRNRDGVKEEADCPATWVNWDDASLFCELLTQREREAGRLPQSWTYRLPTEAQWEYASRAGAKTRFFFGDTDENMGKYAWCAPETANTEHAFAHPIGLKESNSWGLYDVHGNVMEWCRDGYANRLFGGNDPETVKADPERHVARGGDWRRGPDSAALAHREPLSRLEVQSVLGFRVVVIQTPDVPEAVRPKEYRIAIGPFENSGTSIENRPLGHAISEMLEDDLSKVNTIRIVERHHVDDVIEESSLSKPGTVEDARSTDRDQLLTNIVLTGKFRADDGKLSIEAQLMKRGSHEQIGDWSLEGSVDDLFRLEADLVHKILQDLDVDDTNPRVHIVREGLSPPTLAIPPLRNHTPNQQFDDLGTGLAEVIQSNLSAISRISLVERERLKTLMAERRLSSAEDFDANVMMQLGKLAGAERILMGSFLELKNDVCVQVRLIDTDTASVLASHKVIGPRDHFNELIEQLTRLIVSDLAAQPIPDADDILAKRLMARTLGGTVHQATIARLTRQGKFAEAADVCQQAITIEPGNLYFYREQVSLLRSINKNDDALRTISLAVARPEFTTASESDRKGVVGGELVSLFRLSRFAEMIPAAERYKKAFSDPRSRDMANAWICTALESLNRGDEIAPFLEKNATEETDPSHDWENYALRRLFVYYRDDAPLRLRTQRNGKRMPYNVEAAKALAKRTFAIYERVLKSVAGHQDESASEWARLLIPQIASISFVDSTGTSIPFLTSEQQLDSLKRGIETFEWNAAVASLGRFRLAQMLEGAKKWEDALQIYRELARSQQGVVYSSVPSTWDLTSDEPTSWIDRKIESYYRVAKILEESLERKEEAREAYRELVREVGLSHFAGADALVGMNRLKMTPDFPQKCALIWGGETSAVLSWQKVLEPAGFKVHSLRELRLNPPQLTPYSLVVLNRAGDLPYTPREILALRSYVASGGSLLVIVSPGWESAVPGIHNPLLSFFGMECQTDSVIEAMSTRLAAHPIAAGIKQVIARNAVHILGNDAATVIQARDKVVLAATPYRFGRVVVASFGQWYLPDTSILPENWQNLVSAGRKENVHLAPIEFGAHLETPLLMNVVRWLTEPQKRDAKFAAWRKTWIEAQWTAWRAQAHVEPASMRLVPWDEMRPVLDRVIKSAPDSIAKEESLWFAGEAFQQMGFYHFGDTGAEPRPHLTYSAYGYNLHKTPPLLPDPKYYHLLIQQFPQSTLRPYAEWRFVECLRRSRFVNGSPQIITNIADAPKLIGEYEKIKAPPRSFARAWKNLRLGAILISTEDYNGAIPKFQEVVETMPNGPEKTISVLNLALCYEKVNKAPEARRYYQLTLEMPELHWRPTADWFMLWSPLTIYKDYVPPAFGARGHAWQMAKDGLSRLQDSK